MDWEQRYQENDMPWEKGDACPGLVDWLVDNPMHGRVLVPGCGYGHDARAIADAGGAYVSVLGVDIAESAVRGAKERTTQKNCSFELGDFFALRPELQGSFDVLWEHTCFCAIDRDRRADYVRAAADALRPGGLFVGIFYLRPRRAPGHEGPPFGTTREELDGLFEEDFVLLEEWIPQRAYPGREGCELMRSLRRRA